MDNIRNNRHLKSLFFIGNGTHYEKINLRTKYSPSDDIEIIKK